MDSHGKRLGDGSLLAQDADEGLGHTVPVATYNKVFLSLVVLTFITVFAAYQPVGVIAHILIAVTIAAIKAFIVGYVFMHLKYEGTVIWASVICPFILFFLLVVGTLGDLSVKESPAPAIEALRSTAMPSTIKAHHE